MRNPRLSIAIFGLMLFCTSIAPALASENDNDGSIFSNTPTPFETVTLANFEKKIFSQNGEDGVTRKIFDTIGTTNKYFVEFWTYTGEECNTRDLRTNFGWHGLLMDGSHEDLSTNLRMEFITAENINDLFEKYDVPHEFDLLSIDIDYNDFYVWNAIKNYRPRVVIIEYNGTFPPNEDKVAQYNSRYMWDSSNYFGASIFSLNKLGQSKGYTLVHADSMGVNLFFIRSDILQNASPQISFTDQGIVESLYKKPGYGSGPNGGHFSDPLGRSYLTFDQAVSQEAHGCSPKTISESPISDIPLGNDEKIVRDLFTITIPGYPYAYNPSIVPLDDGFLLSFRYRPEDKKSIVGLVRLNKNFEVVGEPTLLASSRTLEDARLFWHDGKVWATCTDVTCWDPIRTCTALCQITLDTPSFISVVDLDYHPREMEKNWVPLLHKDDKGTEDLYLVYTHDPLHVRKVVSPIQGITEETFSEERCRDVPWVRKWGQISGGTPCISLGKEQLAFFHSRFNSDQVTYYVMGAVTFENTPPFRIKKISPHPIVARGMFTIPWAPLYPPWCLTMRVVFPGGLVRMEKNGEWLLYVVYGENDSGVRVMVVDEKELLNSLIDFTS